MAARRYVSITDVTVAIVAAVAIFLPARPLEGTSAAKGDDDARFALAAAEARVRVHPDDGRAVEDLSRRLIQAGEADLAVDASAEAARAMRGSPERWRALIATAKAYGELRDVDAAFKWGEDAQGAYQDGDPAFPAWEKTRIDFYVDFLRAGRESGIDPRVDPEGFRAAAEKGWHLVHVGGNPQTNPPTVPTPAPAPPTPAPGP